MKAYKLHSYSAKGNLEKPHEENSILEKYLASKKNIQTFQERTALLEKPLTEKESKIEEKCNEDVFSSRTSEIIEAFQEYFPSKPPLETLNECENNENATLRANDKDLQKSIESIDEAFKTIRQTIENPVVCSRTTYKKEEGQAILKNRGKDTDQFREEKSDNPKLWDSTTTVSFEKALEPSDRVERILKMVEIEYKPSRQLLPIQPKCKNDISDLKGPFDIDYWDKQFERYSYYAFFVLLFALFLVSTLRSTHFVFKTAKKYFDKALMHCWNWVRGIFAPSHPSNEQNIILLVLLTPFIILLLIAYSGFSILYIINKILLMRVPNLITQQMNLQKTRGFENF